MGYLECFILGMICGAVLGAILLALCVAGRDDRDDR